MYDSDLKNPPGEAGIYVLGDEDFDVFWRKTVKIEDTIDRIFDR
jgi:hypothetical protein